MISVASLVAGSTVAISCGYEDPNGADVARGFLNWSYPNALYVTSAVWRAQSDGVIPANESVPNVKVLLGYDYRQSVNKLDVLRAGLIVAAGRQSTPVFSMVLIGPMLWTRFEGIGTALTMTPHVNGPSKGDVVVITDEPVVAALIDKRVTPQVARELGLIRFYGPLEAVQEMTSWLDRLGAEEAANALTTITDPRHAQPLRYTP